MQARRFTLAVPDRCGKPRRGEVLLAEHWQPELLVAGSQEDGDLLAAFLRAHPEMTETSLDAAVSEFRRLLTEEVAAQKLSEPTRQPRIVLDASAASRARG